MTNTQRQGFTLIELLVVISIIAILAGMLLPAISMVRESARKANCGSNQRQVILAMTTYGSENDGVWPYCQGADTAYGTIVTPTATTGKQSSIATLEFISAWSDGELVAKLFACPSNAAVKPGVAADTALTTGSTTTQWTLADVGFAFDPAVPSNAKATRVVLADRPIDATTTNHKKVAIVVFGDGHVGNITRSTGSAGTPAAFSSGAGGGTAATVTGVFPNADASADNIYDGASDGTVAGAGSLGKGSSTRAFVR